ncbi:unnamed protein product [Cylicocyclus nassatus]|uniref:Uncharacterized protein n=1 Tax=Cylicocyclus nassatus TaxID=53992 RepID=A0AA36GRY9_CYLNA|nr:unnamed protein product [Cylicocyclus nassatus]
MFRALQVALRDVRQSRYDYNEERFVPSSRKGKRVRVSDTSAGAASGDERREAAGDENVSP